MRKCINYFIIITFSMEGGYLYIAKVVKLAVIFRTKCWNAQWSDKSLTIVEDKPLK